MLGAPLLEGRFTLWTPICHSGPSVYGLSGNHRVHLYPQVGINMPVTVLRWTSRRDASRGTLIAVSDRGRSELVNDEIVLEANRRGWIVWMLDPALYRRNGRAFRAVCVCREPAIRRTHAMVPGERHSANTEACWWLRFAVSDGNLRARQSHGTRGFLRCSDSRARRLEWTALREAVSSFREMTDSPLALIPFGAFKSFDIPDLWKAARGKIHPIRSPEEFTSKEW